jgi:hypothetical protein
MVARGEDDVAKLAGFLFAQPGPVLAVAKIGPSSDEPVFPSMDGPELVHTFRNAVLGNS